MKTGFSDEPKIVSSENKRRENFTLFMKYEEP